MAYLNTLISRTREQMRLELADKKRRADEASRRAKLEEERRAKEEDDRKKAEAEAKLKGAEGVVKTQQGVSEENKLAAQQHYIEGLKYFQNSDYDKARDEWTITRQLDPSNIDAASGLKRIEQIRSGGQ